MENIALIGPPGSGKGTQSKFIAKEFGLVHFSAGECLRNNILNNTKLGMEAKKYIDDGNLVPDHVAINMIEQELNGTSCVLDGFPRTLGQAKWLNENLNVKAVIALITEDKILQDRLNKRALKSNRLDDRSEVINHRFKVYHELTNPILNFYKGKSNFYVIDAKPSIENISKNIYKLVKNLFTF